MPPFSALEISDMYLHCNLVIMPRISSHFGVIYPIQKVSKSSVIVHNEFVKRVEVRLLWTIFKSSLSIPHKTNNRDLIFNENKEHFTNTDFPPMLHRKGSGRVKENNFPILLPTREI